MATRSRQLTSDLLDSVFARAKETAVFGDARIEHDGGVSRLVCDARGSSEPAFYSVFEEDGKVWVALQTAARYLSQSIEADLMFTGDKLPDLLHEELMDLGWADVAPGAPELPVEHYRTSDSRKLYTFRSPMPDTVVNHAETLSDAITIALLAYEATFRHLGDMQGDDE